MSRINSSIIGKQALHLFTVMMVSATLCLGTPSSAWAHKVNVFAYVEGETIVTESYFSDGRKCHDSTIRVFDDQQKKLLEGKTDSEGRFSFPIPSRTDLLIRLSASTGHQAEYTIPAADLSGIPAESIPAASEIAQEPRDGLESEVPAEPPAESAVVPPQAVLSAADVEAAVDRALARQLAPIRRELEESRAKARFSDIVGGMGYIIGLVGLALYFHSRRRQE